MICQCVKSTVPTMDTDNGFKKMTFNIKMIGEKNAAKSSASLFLKNGNKMLTAIIIIVSHFKITIQMVSDDESKSGYIDPGSNGASGSPLPSKPYCLLIISFPKRWGIKSKKRMTDKAFLNSSSAGIENFLILIILPASTFLSKK